MRRSTKRLLLLLLALPVTLHLFAWLYQLGMLHLEGKPRTFGQSIVWAAETLTTTGYGADSPSGERLRRLPLTEVKIPGQLVRAAEPGAQAALRDEVALAHEHGLRVVAEGIETPQDLEECRRLGIPYGQGFYLAVPEEVPAKKPARRVQPEPKRAGESG